jgi:integrase
MVKEARAMRGSIRKRGGKWVTVLDLGPDLQTGKRRQQKRTHTTQQAAQAHVAAVLSQMQTGDYVPPTKLRTGEFLERWLRDYAETGVGPVTLRGYRDAIRRKIIPALGPVLLRHLAPSKVQEFYAAERARGQSPATVHATHRVLRTALGQALREGLVSRNAAQLATPPRVRRRAVPVWDAEQLALFLGAASKDGARAPLFLTAIATGMRMGELLGLRWEDVDWGTGTITARQTFYRLGAGRWLWKTPKTESSRRTIPLGPRVLEALRGVERMQTEQRRLLGPEYSDLDLVFCQPNGNPLHAHNLTQRELRRLCERAGIPRLRFHDLRHLNATYLALAGVPVKVAQERLRHSSARITQEIYQHVLSGQQRQAALDVEAALFGRDVPPDVS